MAEIGYYKTEVKNPVSGEKMYSVRLAAYSVIDSEQIVDLAVKDSNVKRHDMAVGFSALCQAIEDFVLQGHSVTLEGLGNFRLSAKSGVWDSENNKWTSAGKDNKEDVTSKDIKGVYLRFRPCTALRTELNNASLFDVTKTPFGGAKGGYDHNKLGESTGSGEQEGQNEQGA